MPAARLLVGFLPVLLFLAALVYLDSYKLVRLRWILSTIVLGGAVAGASLLANEALGALLALEGSTYSRYVAPLLEESAKAALIIYLIRSHRVGFLVDAAIYGFGVGTGFAVVENLTYLKLLPEARLAAWVVRGFGTAMMHGGATAIFGITSKAFLERREVPAPAAFLPGLLAACAIHSAFNHFFLTPVLSAVGVLLALPPLIFAVFSRSEKALRSWLDVGFDADAELLELIHSGELSRSRVGMYLQSLKDRFPGEIVADMLCYLRIHVELSVQAKGLLMMRESGFKAEPDEGARANLRELAYLERSIGRTGRLAMAPFLTMSGKDLWQLYMLRR